MKLYRRECRRIATGLVYYLFLAVLVFGWSRSFRGVTKTEIDWAEGIAPTGTVLDRPLLSKPSREDAYFGNKTSEDDPDAIMTGVTRALLLEYGSNCYATYPFGYYKAVTLDADDQERVLAILCEITGLAEEQLENLPKNYFPAVTGTIISVDQVHMDENGAVVIPADLMSTDGDMVLSADQMSMDEDGEVVISGQIGNGADHDARADKTKHFISQVTYDHFKELMREMEQIIGEKGSKYSPEMMITYFGMAEKNYEEALAEYEQTIVQDKVTGGFARLFCDYMGLSLGLYPVFIAVLLWLQDRRSNVAELIYSRRISSARLVLSRYLAAITMVLIPVIALSLESLIPLVSFGAKNGIPVDYLAYLRYICWWLLPTVMAVCAVGTFFTLLTDSPIAIALQFLWWVFDKGVTGLSGDTGITTLMVRHNTLRGCELIRDGFGTICVNRAVIAGVSILLVLLSVWVLEQKRKGRINAAKIYGRYLGNLQSKFSSGYQK